MNDQQDTAIARPRMRRAATPTARRGGGHA